MLYGVIIAEVPIAPLIGGLTRPLPIPDLQATGKQTSLRRYSPETVHADSSAPPHERSVAGPSWPFLGVSVSS